LANNNKVAQMGLIDRLFGGNPRVPRGTLLYAAIIARGREPHWYVEGAVPDTMDGRFDMIAAIIAVTLVRLETETAQDPTSIALTEMFIADMDGQLRESGVGDVGLSKQVGLMVSMLGGRLGAYRDGIAAGDLGPALVRNLYRGTAPSATALIHVNASLLAFHAALATETLPTLLAGSLP